MNDVTEVLVAIERGDPSATDRLMPLVYADLRRLAESRLVNEKPGQTIQATALVHEVYLRLVGKKDEGQRKWNSRGHFYAAAGEVMRRILVENARRRNRLKGGAEFSRVDLDVDSLMFSEVREDLVALDEALNKLAATDRQAAELVQLRYFAGLTFDEAGEALGVSGRTARRIWDYARAWIRLELQDFEENG